MKMATAKDQPLNPSSAVLTRFPHTAINCRQEKVQNYSEPDPRFTRIFFSQYMQLYLKKFYIET